MCITESKVLDYTHTLLVGICVYRSDNNPDGLRLVWVVIYMYNQFLFAYAEVFTA